MLVSWMIRKCKQVVFCQQPAERTWHPPAVAPAYTSTLRPPSPARLRLRQSADVCRSAARAVTRPNQRTLTAQHSRRVCSATRIRSQPPPTLGRL